MEPNIGPEVHFLRELLAEYAPALEYSQIDKVIEYVGKQHSARHYRHWVIERTDPIEKHYELLETLGQPGQFGSARLGKHIASQQLHAIKTVAKQRFIFEFPGTGLKSPFDELRAEIAVMEAMNHPNIITFHACFEDPVDLHVAMEVCMGGEVFDRLAARKRFSEKDAAFIMKQVCEGVAYMHSHGVAHCDLKPSNTLFVTKAEDSPIKIIDFTFSKFVKRRTYFKRLRGTPFYIAPEVLEGQYAEHCDMWSFGVMVFVLVFGYPPFRGDSNDDIFQQIQYGFYNCTRPGWGPHFPEAIKASAGAKDFIAKCLDMDPARRVTAAEALQHPWLQGRTASNAPTPPQVLDMLVKFHSGCKLKRAVLKLMVDALTDEDLQGLEESFVKMDTNKDGFLCADELSAALAQHTNNLPDCDVAELLAAADMDGDARLSYAELVMTCVHTRLDNKEERLYRSFCKLDQDGSGTITADELQAVLDEAHVTVTKHDGSACDAMEMLKEADMDGDGMIDYDEFVRMWRHRQGSIEEHKPSRRHRRASLPLPTRHGEDDLQPPTSLGDSHRAKSAPNWPRGLEEGEGGEEGGEEEEVAPKDETPGSRFRRLGRRRKRRGGAGHGEREGCVMC